MAASPDNHPQEEGIVARFDKDPDVPDHGPSVQRTQHSWWRAALSLHWFGLVSFGGPLAHVAMLQQRYVSTLKWLSPPQFTELFALANSVPGPSSTQLVGAISAVLFGGGVMGGLLGLFFFMTPGAIVMGCLGILAGHFSGSVTDLRENSPAFQAVVSGMGSAALGTIMVAVMRLTRRVVKNWLMGLLVLLAGLAAVMHSAMWTFPVIILGCGTTSVVHAAVLRRRHRHTQITAESQQQLEHFVDTSAITRKAAIVSACLFVGLLIFFFVGARTLRYQWLIYSDIFYRIGSLVFGGGHVVLPMIMAELVENHFLTQEQFMDAFSLSQLMPGPMFNLSAYIGGLIGGVPGALLCWICLSLPGILLIFTILSFWRLVREYQVVKDALDGFNAGACGLILSSIILLWFDVVGTSKALACVTVLSAGIMLLFELSIPLLVLLGGAISPFFGLVLRVS